MVDGLEETVEVVDDVVRSRDRGECRALMREHIGSMVDSLLLMMGME